MLASLLKLLPNNDVQAHVQSHACFFACARLFVPDKVHSSLSRNYFPVVALVLPSVVEFTSQSSTSGSHKKNRRHTASNEHVSVANVSARNRSEDTPAGTNRAKYQITKISRPHRSRRYLPIREKYVGPVFVWRYHSLACLSPTTVCCSHVLRQHVVTHRGAFSRHSVTDGCKIAKEKGQYSKGGIFCLQHIVI